MEGKTMKTPYILVLTTMMLFGIPALASAATVSVGDPTTNGSIVSVPINVSGAPDIGAMTITLTYNSSVISATNVSKGSVTFDALLVAEDTIIDNPPLGSYENDTISDADNDTVWNHGAIIGNTTDGMVNISMISTDGFRDDGTLTVITFDIVGSGTTPLNLSDVSANETATCDPCTNETVFDPASYPAIPITRVNSSYTSEEYDSADTNQDCVVSMPELMTQIGKWKLQEIGMPELMTSIGRWKLGSGGYC
ncbi:MAG: hypothetical protein C4B59_08770 [Candidatus Methanogaster sp.]|uniref:Uncharacterized protein n=1 Tax=Candidatus Methanogaster sp. TaxID=3386292 RepID=A0AC61L2N6_9EURY|nr:MAG: hypothetical protein C4B59_08770 [ANME-2 cluster archaeon]